MDWIFASECEEKDDPDDNQRGGGGLGGVGRQRSNFRIIVVLTVAHRSGFQCRSKKARRELKAPSVAEFWILHLNLLIR